MPLHEIYLDALHSAPDKSAIIVDDASLSYREMDELAQLWARAMLRLGIQKGDRVSILMPNRIEYMPLYFACYRIGAIASPMSCVCQSALEGDPVNTAKAFTDGWLKTGDLAYQDEDGYYFFVGRIKNIIVKGGGNIAPAEVEDAIRAHPAVRLCGVIGDPDPEMGQVIHAFVVLNPSPVGLVPTPRDLADFVGKRISAMKVPDRWTFVPDLPLASIGKIDRKKLAEFARCEP
jgi:acyl-CoA synthetase (AMP-forming)/AMP-acid ligase II